MKIKTIIDVTKAEILQKNGITGIDIKYAFAADLMSDTLFIISREEEPVLLISGITDQSVVRTAVILDIPAVLIVRGKTVPQKTIELAKKNNIIMLKTYYIMFVTCGLLYKEGLKGAPWQKR